MTRHQRRFDDADFDLGERRGSVGVGSIVLATALGVGIGLLVAPDAGVKTRRRLRRQLLELSGDLEGGLEELQGLSGRARTRVLERLAQARKRGEDVWGELEDRFGEEEEGSGAVGAALALVAGVAATYFLTSERAEPARTRVREKAEEVRRQATDRWERFQTRRHEGANGQPGTSPAGETRSGPISSSETSQPS